MSCFIIFQYFNMSLQFSCAIACNYYIIFLGNSHHIFNQKYPKLEKEALHLGLVRIEAGLSVTHFIYWSLFMLPLTGYLSWFLLVGVTDTCWVQEKHIEPEWFLLRFSLWTSPQTHHSAFELSLHMHCLNPCSSWAEENAFTEKEQEIQGAAARSY